MKKIIKILLIALIVYAVIARINDLSNEKYTEETYIVQKGDTLYDIALQNADNNTSINEYIYKLKKVNNIDSNLEIGQEIIIFK